MTQVFGQHAIFTLVFYHFGDVIIGSRGGGDDFFLFLLKKNPPQRRNRVHCATTSNIRVKTNTRNGRNCRRNCLSSLGTTTSGLGSLGTTTAINAIYGRRGDGGGTIFGSIHTCIMCGDSTTGTNGTEEGGPGNDGGEEFIFFGPYARVGCIGIGCGFGVGGGDGGVIIVVIKGGDILAIVKGEIVQAVCSIVGGGCGVEDGRGPFPFVERDDFHGGIIINRC